MRCVINVKARNKFSEVARTKSESKRENKEGGGTYKHTQTYYIVQKTEERKNDDNNSINRS